MLLWRIYCPHDGRFQTPILCYSMHTHRHKAFSYWARPKVNRESYVRFSSYSLHLCPDVFPQLLTFDLPLMSRVPFVHGTIPRPSAFTVRLSHGLEMQLRVGQQAADKLSSGSVRWTEAIVAKRRSVRFTCSTSKGPGVRHTIHRQE